MGSCELRAIRRSSLPVATEMPELRASTSATKGARALASTVSRSREDMPGLRQPCPTRDSAARRAGT